jgi:biotin transport system substrate-specific component
MNMHKTSIQNMTKIALFTAIIAVCAMISFPLPSGVPVTLQTFAIALTGFVLGWKKGLISVAVYLALGMVGVPVFSGFTGGFAKIFGVTGGYLWGFLLMVLLCGLVARKRRVLCGVLSLAGLALCHIAGVIQFAVVADSSPLSAFLLASAPYLVKDVASVVVAYLVAEALQKALSMRKSTAA